MSHPRLVFLSGMKKELNAKEVVFKDAYLQTMNAYQSAVAAGYSKTTANKKAPLWVCKSREKCPENKLHVWDAVHQAMAKRSEETQITAKLVLTRLGEMMDADPCDIIDRDTGCYLPIHDWPIVWRRMLSAADVQELYSGRGEEQQKIGEIIKYKFIDKMKLFDLIGKHVDVQAFKMQLGITDETDLADRITKSRKRINNNEDKPRVH